MSDPIARVRAGALRRTDADAVVVAASNGPRQRDGAGPLADARAFRVGGLNISKYLLECVDRRMRGGMVSARILGFFRISTELASLLVSDGMESV